VSKIKLPPLLGGSKYRVGLIAVLTVGLVVSMVGVGLASHPLASLPGSNFEIDVDANLKVDDAGKIDWGSVSEVRKNDLPTGRNDDSYAGGSKEDDACPATTTGSIPNNKSDLRTFGVYVEDGSPGFLNIFWTRVQEPSGTTLMDFELNQSGTDCGNGVNPLRTAGDLLIEYRIEQGGASATIKVREWTGSAWGPAVDLTGVAATGTINSSAIPGAEADGLGPLSPRTFGEAQLDLDFIFDPDQCTSFGSAMLKSRSSDSFTSQMKDFIKPQPVNITNCGKVIIHKQTDPDEDPNTTSFGYTTTVQQDPAGSGTFSLTDDGTETRSNVLFGTGYTVTEDTPPAGWDLAGVDCSASVGVTPSINGATVTFDIDDAFDVLECTYTNRARGTIIIKKVTSDGSGAFDFTSGTLTPAAFTLTTTGPGQAGSDSRTFSDLNPGTYDAAETVPAGWNLDSATCSDGSNPASIGLSGGESVTCTFTNSREKGAILITKTRKHAADGPGDHPHAGVDFKISGGSLSSTVTVTTDANGEACLDGLVLSSFVGDYTVEEVVPNGYLATPTSDTVTVTTEATCGSGNEAGTSFENTPLTDITVTVDSQVDGGTASTITCGTDEAVTDENGDGSLTLEDLVPGTYECTIVVDP
jgi:hypothetical protein